jgi:hypothetical protein
MGSAYMCIEGAADIMQELTTLPHPRMNDCRSNVRMLSPGMLGLPHLGLLWRTQKLHVQWLLSLLLFCMRDLCVPASG